MNVAEYCKEVSKKAEEYNKLSKLCEWSMNHYFKDRQIELAFEVLQKQMKLYFTACEQRNHEVTQPVEEAITNRLFPKLEQLILADTRLGGKHEMYTRWHQNSSYFWVDNIVICNYQAGQGQIARELMCPIEKPCDLKTEGEKILEMTEDLYKMSVRDFLAKHNVPPPVNGLVTFLDEVSPKATLDSVTDVKYFPPREGESAVRSLITIRLYDNDDLLSLYSFVSSNPEYFGYNRVSFVDGKFNYRDNFNDIFIPNNVTMQIALHRELTEKDYVAERLTIEGKENNYTDIAIIINEINDNGFEKHIAKLVQFFNEQVHPLHLKEEADEIPETFKAKKAKTNIER